MFLHDYPGPVMMLNNKRWKKILEILEQNDNARVSELSEMLEESEATIRRDLDRLSEKELIERVHGGAILAKPASPQPPVLQRTGENVAEKERIGEAAAALIEEGETVFIGSGTTTMEVARNLKGRHKLTIITNALTVLNILAEEKDITVISTGGLLRLSELSFIGHITEQTLEELRPQKVIMGMRAISVIEGLTNEYLPEVATDRVIIKSAPEVIIVADYTKFRKVSTCYVAPIDSVSKIITDSFTSIETIEEIRSLGVEVIAV